MVIILSVVYIFFFMDLWCYYCEDQLQDSFFYTKHVDSRFTPDATRPLINWHKSKIKYSARSKLFLLLTKLHYCDCCYRHQIDKPCIPKNCTCDCRHTARMICRSWNF
jgi:hypothetical protein